MVAANLVPLIGALFYGWDANLVLALFWIENLIIGAFNLLKMLSIVVYRAHYHRLFVCVFFVLHYGLFCSIHGLLLWDLLDLGAAPDADSLLLAGLPVLDVFAEGQAVLYGFVEQFWPTILLAIGALAISHTVSFVEHFWLRGEVYKLSVNKLMARPYTHIIALHVGLIAGALLLEMFGSPLWLLAVIVVLKLLLDLYQHQKRHQKAHQQDNRIKDI